MQPRKYQKLTVNLNLQNELANSNSSGLQPMLMIFNLSGLMERPIRDKVGIMKSRFFLTQSKEPLSVFFILFINLLYLLLSGLSTTFKR